MRRTLVAACLLATVSCWDDDSGDGSSYVTIDAIADAYKDAQCMHLTACGLFASLDACLGAELQTAQDFTIDYEVIAAVSRGHIVYDGGAVHECLAALGARSCDRTSESARVLPAACDEFFRGTRTAGQICFLDEECASQQCSGSSAGTCSMGVCIGDTAPVDVEAQVGEACATTSSCVDGAYCDTVTDRCTTLKTTGTECTLDNECAYGLACIGPTGARVCGALPTVGQGCAADGICRDEGTYCDVTADACKPVGLAGAICTDSSECSPYFPCAGTCTQGPGLGQACSSSSRCFEAGTFCDFNAGLCAAKKADGAPCDSGPECESDFCDFSASTGTCASATTCR